MPITTDCPKTECPTQEQLSAYSLGQLPPDAASAIENCINDCETCCETIVGLTSDDTFLGLLKEANQLPLNQTLVHDSVGTTPSSTHDGIPASLASHPRYEIESLIGKGGMGDVYRASHRMMKRTVALKVIKHELVRKPEAIDRFHREVTTAAQLSHPNIVTAFDAEHADNDHFMVMEFVDGVDLYETVKADGPLSIEQACNYIHQAAMGLQHAHELGMVHRDIKPHNLMVTSDGIVKILDFGLASLSPTTLSESDLDVEHSHLTAAGTIMGTPDFIAPEQAQDAHQADIRSDIYSLGATLYYLLAGDLPFPKGSALEKIRQHLEEQPTPLKLVRKDVPDQLDAIVNRMLAKDPAERFQSPADVAEALKVFASIPDPSMVKGEHKTGIEQIIANRKSRTWVWAGGVLMCIGLAYVALPLGLLETAVFGFIFFVGALIYELIATAMRQSAGYEGLPPGSPGSHQPAPGPNWLSVAANVLFYLSWIPIGLLLLETFLIEETSVAAADRTLYYILAAVGLSSISGTLLGVQRFKSETEQWNRGDHRVIRWKPSEAVLVIGILAVSCVFLFNRNNPAKDYKKLDKFFRTGVSSEPADEIVRRLLRQDEGREYLKKLDTRHRRITFTEGRFALGYTAVAAFTYEDRVAGVVQPELCVIGWSPTNFGMNTDSINEALMVESIDFDDVPDNTCQMTMQFKTPKNAKQTLGLKTDSLYEAEFPLKTLLEGKVGLTDRLRNASFVRGVPVQGKQIKNAAVQYRQAFALLPKMNKASAQLISHVERNQRPLGDVKQFLKECQSALKVAARVQVETPCDWGLNDDGLKTELPHLLPAKLLGSLYVLQARFDLEAGSQLSAVENLTHAMVLARNLDEGYLAQVLTGCAIESKVIDLANSIVPILTQTARENFLADLQSLQPRPDFSTILRNGRDAMLKTLKTESNGVLENRSTGLKNVFDKGIAIGKLSFDRAKREFSSLDKETEDSNDPVVKTMAPSFSGAFRAYMESDQKVAEFEKILTDAVTRGRNVVESADSKMESSLKLLSKSTTKPQGVDVHNYIWMFEGENVGEITLKLLLAKDGKTMTARELTYRSDQVDSRITVRLRAEKKFLKRASNQFAPTLEVTGEDFDKIVDNKKDDLFPATINGTFQNRIEHNFSGPITSNETQRLYSHAFWSGDLQHGTDMKGMIEATKKGATFVFVTLEWKPIGDQGRSDSKETINECEAVQDALRKYYMEKYPLFAASVNQRLKVLSTPQKLLDQETRRQIGELGVNSPVTEVINSFPGKPYVTFTEVTQVSANEVSVVSVNLYREADGTCRVESTEKRRKKRPGEPVAKSKPITDDEIHELVLNAGQEQSTEKDVTKRVSDLERLQGDWEVIAFTQDGKKELAANKGVSMSVKIKSNTISRIQTRPNGEKSEKVWGRIELDSKTNPKSIDIVNPDGPSGRLLGIYELKEGKLKICFAEQTNIDVDKGRGVKRPTTFDAPTGSRIVLLECFKPKDPVTAANEFWRILVKGDISGLEELYADEIALKPGSEFLKPRWGINPSGDRAKELKVTKPELIKAYKAMIDGIGRARWQGIFEPIKKDKISTLVLKNEHVLLTVKTGTGDDYIEFELALDKDKNRWLVVSEFTDY